MAMLAESQDDEQIIARVAALDIGKAELVCCVRVPAPAGDQRRMQEVSMHSTMTAALTKLWVSPEIVEGSFKLRPAGWQRFSRTRREPATPPSCAVV